MTRPARPPRSAAAMRGRLVRGRSCVLPWPLKLPSEPVWPRTKSVFAAHSACHEACTAAVYGSATTLMLIALFGHGLKAARLQARTLGEGDLAVRQPSLLKQAGISPQA